MKTRIACCQMDSGFGSKEKNVEKMVEMIERAAADRDVDLVVLPEMVNVGFKELDQLPMLAESFPDGYTAKAMIAQAKKHGIHIVYGYLEENPDGGKPFNAAGLIDDKGTPLGRYRKSHLVDEIETPFIEKGTEYPVFDTSIGKIGIMICWDTAYPEVARILALKGAEIIAVPTAWETEATEGDWTLVNSARSFDNIVYLASANRIGQDIYEPFIGQSMITGPNGRQIIKAGDGEEVIKAEVDLSLIPELRNGYYVLLRDRNPATYDELVKSNKK